jgi:hypothetical protein
MQVSYKGPACVCDRFPRKVRSKETSAAIAHTICLMSQSPAQDDRPIVAAIAHDGGDDVDALLAAFAHRQRARGRRVLGLVMRHRAAAEGCRAAMFLSDLDSGREYLVSQALGADSTSCRADPQGFAQASAVLRDALEREPDLVVCNRFGVLEAEGGGFAAELLALLERGIAVLTVVGPRHADAWQRFVGEADALTSDPADWERWFDAVMRKRQVSDGTAR